MTDQLTPWYDPKVDGQPVRVGEFERLYGPETEPFIFRDFWNGKRWSIGEGGRSIWIQDLPWRGLTEPNEEKQ